MTKPTWDQILRWRIERQFLGSTRGEDTAAVARRLGGVHAQLAASAVTALDLRVAGGATAESVDGELWGKRRLVKTWAARGTLHLLPADDLPTWVAARCRRRWSARWPGSAPPRCTCCPPSTRTRWGACASSIGS
ncbi:DNA glycosylase AlkZ-like family protein [Phytohabitans kaempferiae]|uniref:DNA glycosylase AlkZ-like family protein n=1 Tax=Phytohabitans kaempferiae TaxID=1620943 RepID=A0ABV6MFN7_9ACTN